jgi:hypothetical protein
MSWRSFNTATSQIFDLFSGRNLRQRWKGFAAQIDRVIGARAANNHVEHEAQLAVVAFLFLVNVFNLGESDFFTDFY